MATRRVCVVGAGITGCRTAGILAATPGVHVTVVDKSRGVGGRVVSCVLMCGVHSALVCAVTGRTCTCVHTCSCHPRDTDTCQWRGRESCLCVCVLCVANNRRSPFHWDTDVCSTVHCSRCTPPAPFHLLLRPRHTCGFGGSPFTATPTTPTARPWRTWAPST